MSQLVVEPIGRVRSPFTEKAEAPRQATAPAGLGVAGTVEVFARYEDGLSDLSGFDRIWLVFWFDRAEGTRLKVQPPRSEEKRGVFATRSPHRPNPIGLSAVRLERVVGLVLHVRDLDLVDGTPVLDIKPYIPYADAFPDAKAGWLEARDPRASWSVAFTPEAEAALGWISAHGGETNLRERIVDALALGPKPHAYRRIKPAQNGASVLAVKAWRATFELESEGTLRVTGIASGYRANDLAAGKEAVHALHRAFIEATARGRE